MAAKSVKFKNTDLRGQGVPQVVKNNQAGTDISVKFFTKGGREGQNLQIYRDIDQLNQGEEDYYSRDAKTYTMNNNRVELESQYVPP